jgi:rhamnosyltransferase
MKMNKVSIVIRCYNEEEYIGRLLTGVMQQNIQDKEVILVDSGSTDATLSIASRFPVRILTIRPEAFSFGRSLNTGCHDAQNDYIIVASAHVYPVYKDWIERLLAPFKNKQVAMVYGKQRGGKKTKYSEHQVFASWFPDKSNPDQSHPFCNNANAAIRRSVWEQLPYDETLTGLEDIDWGKRAIQMGKKIAYQADALVIHVHNETKSQIYNRYRREAIALKYISPKEHFNLRDFLRLSSSNILDDYKNALQENLLLKEWISILQFRLMQFWGTYRGFNQRGLLSSLLKRKFYYSSRVRKPPRAFLPYKDDRPLVEYRSEERLFHEDN